VAFSTPLFEILSNLFSSNVNHRNSIFKNMANPNYDDSPVLTQPRVLKKLRIADMLSSQFPA
jgi:hypothetical protein